MDKRQKEVAQASLDAEKEIFKQIEEVYKQALVDIGDKVKILQADDMQSKIYQAQYQKAMKKQIENILDVMNDKNYTNVSEFLNECYNRGFLGTMYDIAGQGIPLVVPIDQEQMVKAIMLDSKISEGLYTKMGKDVNDLKKRISSEISRGVATNLPYSDIARNLNNVANIGINKAKRIAQTEGHRITQAATYDAQVKAKESGADVVKQWDATLDGKTRDTHKKLDGQIREIDEPFEADGKEAMYPADFGDPAEDCNCRCVCLQRARWALDEEELETLQERASYFGLDKTDDFVDFKQKYLYVSESENFLGYTEAERITKNIKYAVDTKIIESREYIEKFNSMAENDDVRREYYKAAKDILKHRSGQNGEDLYLYNTVTKRWYKSTTGKEAGTPEYTKEIIDCIKNAKPNELVSFHNHPAGMPPSADDINAAFKNGYQKGYALCHDGKIYEYTGSDRLIDDAIYNLRIADFQEKGYNEFEAQVETMKYLSGIYGFTFKEIE